MIHYNKNGGKIMIVKDLLFLCSIDDVIEAVLKKEDEKANRDKVYTAYSALIEKLKNRTPNESNSIVLGIEYINFGEPTSDATLYKINEIKNNFKLNDKLENISDIDSLSDSEIASLINEYKHPDSYAYEYEAWNDILGYHIDENNAEKFGKAKLLADILYEMTFFGFEETEVDKERIILKQRTEEIDNILKLPKEEQEKHFISWNDMKKEFGIEEDSPEEELHNRNEMNKEILYNFLQSYTALKEYLSNSNQGGEHNDITG